MLWTLNHTSTHRIKDDVPCQFQEIGIAVNQNSLLAPPKDTAHMSMVPIEARRVDSI